jgi:hypothetical protein
MKNLAFLLPLLLASTANAAGIDCTLWYGDSEYPIVPHGTELTASKNRFKVSITSWNDESYNLFNVELTLPNGKVIKTYGTRVGLAPLDGYVLDYQNNSKLDEVVVTCKAK